MSNEPSADGPRVPLPPPPATPAAPDTPRLPFRPPLSTTTPIVVPHTQPEYTYRLPDSKARASNKVLVGAVVNLALAVLFGWLSVVGGGGRQWLSLAVAAASAWLALSMFAVRILDQVVLHDDFVSVRQFRLYRIVSFELTAADGVAMRYTTARIRWRRYHRLDLWWPGRRPRSVNLDVFEPKDRDKIVRYLQRLTTRRG